MIFAVVGARGRLGSSVCERLSQKNEVLKIDIFGGEYASLDELKITPDAIIDVSCHENSIKTLKFAQKMAIPVVIACTGHSPEELSTIGTISQNLPVFLAYNMAYGVQVFKDAARFIGSQFAENAHLHEMHHIHKKDAPSGTAKEVASIFEEINKPLSISSARGGNVVGTHEVVFFGEGERIVLTHIAESRDAFACGIERAANFISTASCRLYNMTDLCMARAK